MIADCSFFAIGSFFLRNFARDFGDETAHAESFGMMRVQQFERSYFLLAYHAGDAGECEFQLFGFGRRRQEEASLGRARAGGFSGEMNLYDGRSGRMCVEIELQQLEKNFGIEHGKRQERLRTNFV